MHNTKSFDMLFYIILYQSEVVVTHRESKYFVCIIINSNEQISTLCVGKR
ncbi:unknown [synthetic Vaccinia virus]|nr:unknown [synthetic Vaccinia virus]